MQDLVSLRSAGSMVDSIFVGRTGLLRPAGLLSRQTWFASARTKVVLIQRPIANKKTRTRRVSFIWWAVLDSNQ